MKNGKCPKCGSGEIYRYNDPEIGGGVGWGDSPNQIRIKSKWGSDTSKKWETLLCTGCGYYENYILDRTVLDAVIAGDGGWTRV
jgi:predicted nucleic-acid-binding Zn-ribbon protein